MGTIWYVTSAWSGVGYPFTDFVDAAAFARRNKAQGGMVGGPKPHISTKQGREVRA